MCKKMKLLQSQGWNWRIKRTGEGSWAKDAILFLSIKEQSRCKFPMGFPLFLYIHPFKRMCSVASEISSHINKNWFTSISWLFVLAICRGERQESCSWANLSLEINLTKKLRDSSKVLLCLDTWSPKAYAWCLRWERQKMEASHRS